jgi:hypothetical protein
MHDAKSSTNENAERSACFPDPRLKMQKTGEVNMHEIHRGAAIRQ